MFTTVSGQEIKVTFFQQDAVMIQIVVCMATHCSLSTMLPLKTQLIGGIKKYFAIVYFSVSSTKVITLTKEVEFKIILFIYEQTTLFSAIPNQ